MNEMIESCVGVFEEKGGKNIFNVRHRRRKKEWICFNAGLTS